MPRKVKSPLVVVSCKISADDLRSLQEMAEVEDRTISYLIRQVIHAYALEYERVLAE
jgi:predicted transcriptional regulator